MQARVQDQETDNSLVGRILGILKMDRQTYKRIAADPNALPQAAGIVVAVAIANGFAQNRDGGLGFVGGFLAGVIGWVVINAVVTWLGRMVAEPGAEFSFQSALRLLGYAQAPMVLLALAPLPGVSGIIDMAASVWALFAYVIAVQVLAQVSAGKAFLILIGSAIVAGFAIFIVLLPIL